MKKDIICNQEIDIIISYYCSILTSFGQITVISTDKAITGIHFGNQIEKYRNKKDYIEKETNLSKQTELQLEEYFAGLRKSFDIPLCPIGTPFQKKVWEALCLIPFGETRTYKQIAISIGNSNASRAVGMANNKNPISIIIPCHRVIGANGLLVGYAGGLERKEYLLGLEKDNT